MMKINVKKRSKDVFLVTVEQNGSKTKHEVTVTDKNHQLIIDKMYSKELLVEKSFEFLLEREPKEAILKQFDILLINKYFPEYSEKIIRYF